MNRISPGPALLEELDRRRKEELHETALANLAMIEAALRWLWDYLPVEVMSNPPEHFEDENLYDFVMQTENELPPWFDEIREALRND